MEGTPDPLPLVVRPDAAGAFPLSPGDGELHGPSLRVERVGAAKARTYRVVDELACQDDAAGAAISLHCGAQELAHTVVGTGGWQSYRDFELGTIQLAVGASELALRARQPGEVVVNVRALRLLPQ